MGVSLDPQQQQAYQDDGVLFPLTAVTASEASVACGHALDFLERQGPDARAVDSSQVHLFLPWAFDLVTDSRVLDAVEGTAADEEDVRRVHLDVLRLGVLSTALGRNIGNDAFKHLQE